MISVLYEETVTSPVCADGLEASLTGIETSVNAGDGGREISGTIFLMQSA